MSDDATDDVNRERSDPPPLPEGWTWLAGGIRSFGYAESLANFLRQREIPATTHNDPLGQRQAGLAVPIDHLERARELLVDGVDLVLIDPL